MPFLDPSVKEQVHNHMAASNELEALRRSYIKENSNSSTNGHIEAKNNHENFQPNGDAHTNGEHLPLSSAHNAKSQVRQPPQPKFETFMMTGDLIIKTKSSNTGFILPKSNIKQNEVISQPQETNPPSNVENGNTFFVSGAFIFCDNIYFTQNQQIQSQKRKLID